MHLNSFNVEYGIKTALIITNSLLRVNVRIEIVAFEKAVLRNKHIPAPSMHIIVNQ